VTGVRNEESGAASGLVNVAHDSARRSAILVTVFAAAGGTLTNRTRLAHGVAATLMGGTVCPLFQQCWWVALILPPDISQSRPNGCRG
jgi:hypothetical protein